MLQHYNAAVTYINNENEFLGHDHAGKVATARSQLKHFIETLPSCDRDVGASASLLERLRTDDSEAFTQDERRQLATAVSVHMRGVCTGSSPATNDGRNQKHIYLYNYMSNAMWDITWDPEFSDDQKYSAIGDWFLELGLRFPDDDTVKQMIAIIQCGPDGNQATPSSTRSQTPPQTTPQTTPSENYTQLHSFKRKLRAKRETYGGMVTFKVFPENPAEFEELYPGRIAEPSASRVSKDLLSEMTHKDVMPCRSTNKFVEPSPSTALVVRRRNAPPSRAASSGDMFGIAFPNAADGPPTHQQNMHGGNLLQAVMRNQEQQQEMQRRMFQYMMGSGSDIPINVFDRPTPGERSPSPPAFDPTSTSGLAQLASTFRSESNQSITPPRPPVANITGAAGGNAEPVPGAGPTAVVAAPSSETPALQDGVGGGGLHDMIKATQAAMAQKRAIAAAKAAKKKKVAANKSAVDYGASIAADSANDSDDAAAEVGPAADDDKSDDPDVSGDSDDDSEVSAVQKRGARKRPAADVSPPRVLKRPSACIDNASPAAPVGKVLPPPPAPKAQHKSKDKTKVVPPPPAPKAPHKLTKKTRDGTSPKADPADARAAAPKLLMSSLPPISKAPTAYGGGKIYYHKTKNTFRVYLRVGDKIESNVKGLDWSNKKVMRATWLECCQRIANDPRPIAPVL